MVRTITISIIGAAVAAAAVGFQATSSGNRPAGKVGVRTTVIGELVDADCLITSDGMAMGTGHVQCATKCLSGGTPAGLVLEEDMGLSGHAKIAKMRWLLTNPVPLAAYAAETVKVEGTYYESARAMDVEKLYIKQNDKWTPIMINDVRHAG